MTMCNAEFLTLTSPTNGGRSVGIVRTRTKATEFVCFVMRSSVESRAKNQLSYVILVGGFGSVI
jgi:hypothetical protein